MTSTDETTPKANSETEESLTKNEPQVEAEEEEKKDGQEDDKKTETHSEPNLISEKQTSEQAPTEKDEERAAQAMSLDVAYQSLETVRKVNLQVEFGKEVDDTECVPCLRAEHSNNMVQSRFGKWMSKKAASPCLTCSSPVCKSHRSSDFGKQNIAICSECAHLFSSNYLVHQVMQEENDVERKTKINNMLEVYDRAHLILTYSVQFIDEVAVALQGNASRHNFVGLGSSATGVVSGGLGVAAACTILTPVGPPLLLASILFGGGATAATAGSEAVNYRSEPNKMADRILTLHSIITSIARLPGVMDTEAEDAKDSAQNMEDDNGQSRLHWTRTAMNGLKPLTAGALSAISIVTEAREMKNTVDKIRAGNPCEKAERLIEIKEQVKTLPATEELSEQLRQVAERKAKPPVVQEESTSPPESNESVPEKLEEE